MRQAAEVSTRADAFAVSISGLCLLHCLALPVFASLIPMVGILEQEWAHKVLVLAAAPVSLSVPLTCHPGAERRVLSALIATGLLLLVAGAFVEAFEAFETHLTVAGALILAATHTYRWRTHSR
ncbi:MAG: MerC domain-containing protein [Pseudomonadota bacterium]